jgi:class 3 adenylate cyclase
MPRLVKCLLFLFFCFFGEAHFFVATENNAIVSMYIRGRTLTDKHITHVRGPSQYVLNALQHTPLRRLSRLHNQIFVTEDILPKPQPFIRCVKPSAMPLTTEEMDLILTLLQRSDSRPFLRRNSSIDLQLGQSSTIHRTGSSPRSPAASMPGAIPIPLGEPVPLDESMPAAKAMPAPVPSRPLAIVFTDITDSTNLWEEEHNQMWTALVRHDDFMREEIKKFRGYEVKTTGDSFYVVFLDARHALKFCKSVQEKLHAESWPHRITKYHVVNKSTEDGRHFSYKGLNVRMGIHYGEPDVQRWDPNTCRWDFYGRVINASVRVMSEAKAGQIAVSDEFIKQISRELVPMTDTEIKRIWQGLDSTSDTKIKLTAEEEHKIFEKRNEISIPALAPSVRSSPFELKFKGWCKLKGLREKYITLICWKEC